jgi:hypothetical protein
MESRHAILSQQDRICHREPSNVTQKGPLSGGHMLGSHANFPLGLIFTGLICSRTRNGTAIVLFHSCKSDLEWVSTAHLCVFIYCLFNDAVSNSAYIAMNIIRLVTDELERALKQNNRFQIWDCLLSQHLPERTEEKCEITDLRLDRMTA